MQSISRRAALRTGVLGGIGLAAAGLSPSRAAPAQPAKYPPLKGRINHSVAYWPFRRVMTLDEFCVAMKQIGYSAISHCRPYQWPTLKAHGLDSSLSACDGPMDFENGLVTASVHDELVARYLKAIDLAADAGYRNLLIAGGNRRGMDVDEGLTNAENCLKRILGHAEKRGVVLAMAMGNTRQHPDYFFDSAALGVVLCKRVGSPSFGLIYDIYHRQMMEGNIRGTIRKYHEYFVYYHTGGVPGRNEPGDPDQELNYPAICRAIADSGYKGYLAQEYFPKKRPLTKDIITASLRESLHVCDV
ncbi:TIM barrel protein [Cephaloticoccus primus]|uniref:TIM barrel protein n=1 Tax=Cephaloticoccus primus TaxID=1548207 RepID=UPI000837BF6F